MPLLPLGTALRLPFLSPPVIACLAVLLLAPGILAQTPANPSATVTDFDPLFTERPVIPASPDGNPPEALLFGPISSNGVLPKLTAELESVSGPQPWIIEFTEGTDQKDTPTRTILKLQTTPEDNPTHWLWKGKIRLKRDETVPLQDQQKPPKILFKLGNKQATLTPSEIWYFAGGSHLSERESSTSAPQSSTQFFEPAQKEVEAGGQGQAKETLIWQRAKEPGLVASAFVRELRKEHKSLERFPVAVFCITSPRAFLANWLEPGKEFPLTDALWRQPFSAPGNSGCRGLVWWHGEWEADCHHQVSDEALAVKGEAALADLRRHYGESLLKVLRKWREKHGSAGEIRVVQLPSVDHRTKELGFSSLPGVTHPNPLSSWAAVRYAQYDAVVALKDPNVRLYPLLPAAHGSPGYQKPEPSLPQPPPPPKAWADQFGQRGVASQLETVGASLARKRSGPPVVNIVGSTVTVPGLPPPEMGSAFKAEDLFEAFSNSSSLTPSAPAVFTKDGLVITYPEKVAVFRTKASDQAQSLRTLSGELMPAFSTSPPPQP